MPMAISFLAAGVTFRLVYDENPDRGALNAAIVAVHDAFAPPSQYYGTNPRDGAELVAADGGDQTKSTVDAATQVDLPIVALPPARVPTDALPATAPAVGSHPRG